MGITISRYSHNIPRVDLGRQFLDSSGLKESLRRVLQTPPATSTAPTPPSLQRFADMYGEQVTADASADIHGYFTALSVRGLTPGRLPTGYSPLGIRIGNVKPSNTAISVLAEGLAGWYLESTGLIPLARPIGKPDMVFEDRARPGYALVEVKGTQEPNVKTRLLDWTRPWDCSTLHTKPSLLHRPNIRVSSLELRSRPLMTLTSQFFPST
jgi:hypothetical protein